MRIRVAYLNVGSSMLTLKACLEEYKETDLCICGEAVCVDGKPVEVKGRIAIFEQGTEKSRVCAYVLRRSCDVVLSCVRTKCSVSIAFATWIGPVWVTGLYIKPSARKEEVLEILRCAHPSSEIIIGDLNARHSAWDNHTTATGRIVKRWMEGKGYVLLNPNSATHKGHTIDLIWSRHSDWFNIGPMVAGEHHHPLGWKFPTLPNPPRTLPPGPTIKLTGRVWIKTCWFGTCQMRNP
jgi:hypothetical protein